MKVVTSHVMYYYPKNRDKQNAIYISTICLIFSIVHVLLIIVENWKIHDIKVKFACNSVICLNARKLVYSLLHIGIHTDADVVINVHTSVVTDYNLPNVLAIIVRNWTTIQYASKT